MNKKYKGKDLELICFFQKATGIKGRQLLLEMILDYIALCELKIDLKKDVIRYKVEAKDVYRLYRSKDAYIFYLKGYSYIEISKKYGITPVRASHIILRFNQVTGFFRATNNNIMKESICPILSLCNEYLTKDCFYCFLDKFEKTTLKDFIETIKLNKNCSWKFER